MPPILEARPAGGGGSTGGLLDLGTAVMGSDGATANGSFGDVTNLADIVLDASAGDVIGVTFNAITFGNQTFFRVSTIVSAAVVNSYAPWGWYHTTDFTGQGEGLSSEFKFEVLPGDIVTGQVTLRMEGKTTGGTAIVLAGSTFQATNYGPVA